MRWTQRLALSTLALAVAACSAGAPVPLGEDADSPGADASRSGRDGSTSGGIDAAPGDTDASEGSCVSLLDDDLSADRGQVQPAPGFDAAAWSFSGGAYRQQGALEKDRDDASFLVLDDAVSDVVVEVTAASTDVTNHETDNLRQVLLTARASSKDSAYSAVACGIDLGQTGDGPADFKRVIAGELSGSPSAVVTNNRDTSDYDGVSLNEEFRIRMELQGDQMTCRVTVDGTTEFATAGGFGGNPGAVGFHTRETQALFRDVTVCGL